MARCVYFLLAAVLSYSLVGSSMIERKASVRKRIHEAVEACSHLQGLDYYTCCFKKLGSDDSGDVSRIKPAYSIDSNGLYVEAAGAELLAAKCDRLTPKQVKEIAKACNSVNEHRVGDTVRAELMIRCVADKVDVNVCEIPVPSL